MPNLAVIVIGYNERHNLSDCFGSLLKSTYKNYQLIFVDNKSTDGSLDYLKQKFPQVKILKNKGNFGFSNANNKGIRYAKKIKAKYILVLNPDTYIEKNCLKILMQNAKPDTIFQPIILLYKQKKTNLINTTGNVLHFLGFSYCDDYQKKFTNRYNIKKDIASASGAAMLIPTKIIDQIGYFDEVIYPYHEDLDLCWRARIAGVNIKLIPQAILWHKYDYGRNKNKIYFVERNRILFVLKNYQLKTIFLLLPFSVICELLIIFLSLKNHWFLKKLKSYVSIVGAIGYIITARKKINQIRKANDGKLKQFFSGTLSFEEIRIPSNNTLNFILNLYWKNISKYI